jgi:hypothetical protein
MTVPDDPNNEQPRPRGLLGHRRRVRISASTNEGVADDRNDHASEKSSSDLAFNRHMWINSPERKRFVRVVLSTVIGIVILTCISELIAFLATQSDDNYNGDVTFNRISVALVTGAALSYFSAAGLVLYRVLLRQRVGDRIRLGLVADLQKEEEKLAAAGTDFDSLWAITQKRLDFYHDIATQQARTSFRSGQVAAYSGFAVVVLVAILAAFTKNGTGAIAASVIGVAGAGLSAYVGATFMRAQESSASQLRAYFLQPVEFARVLAAERLLEKIEPEGRARVVETIIGSIVTSGDRGVESIATSRSK